MKKRNMSKRFSLNKVTVADLTASEQNRILAGVDEDRCELTVCKSGSVYYQSSTVYIIGGKVIPTPPPTVMFNLPDCIL